MCGQVARTLGLVLAGESGDDLLRELVVEAVQPAPNASRLLVTLSMPEGLVETTEVLQRIVRASGLLRGEVAAAIHRRKTPELTFRVVTRDV